jgi:hypothetical protein
MGLRKRNLYILISFLILCADLAASEEDSLVPRKKRVLVSGIPVVFYTPETRFAFGATGIGFFNFKNDTLNAPRSTVSLGFVYTQNRQILLSLPYNLFLKNRAYHLYGELGFSRFNYNFYGVGNSEPEDYVENYGFQFPRIRITALKRIIPSFYAGVRYAFDDYLLFDLEESGKLIKGDIPGSQGGTVSGVGLVCMFDNRDNVFYPSRGFWGEFVVFKDDPRTGSSFDYTRITLDMTKYFAIKQNIIALNAYTLYSNSPLPFFQMGTLGGIKRMRGFYDGRYRDNNALVFQAEYRRQIWKGIGIAVFGALGQVSSEYHKFNYDYWRYTYGGGLRYMMDKAQKINFRFDVAVGNRMILPYFTVGEAF